MLTTPDNLLFLLFLNDNIQNELFHHLSRDGGEAGWHVVSWVLLLAHFEDWSDSPKFSGTCSVEQNDAQGEENLLKVCLKRNSRSACENEKRQQVDLLTLCLQVPSLGRVMNFLDRTSCNPKPSCS